MQNSTTSGKDYSACYAEIGIPDPIIGSGWFWIPGKFSTRLICEDLSPIFLEDVGMFSSY